MSEKNPLLDLPLDFDPELPEQGWYNGPGVTTLDVPATLSRVLIDVRDLMVTGLDVDKPATFYAEIPLADVPVVAESLGEGCRSGVVSRGPVGGQRQ